MDSQRDAKRKTELCNRLGWGYAEVEDTPSLSSPRLTAKDERSHYVVGSTALSSSGVTALLSCGVTALSSPIGANGRKGTAQPSVLPQDRS